MHARNLICLIGALLVSWRAYAQLVIPDPFFQGTFSEAATYAREKYRLHLIFLDNGDPAQQDATTRLWSNRSVGQWIQWHGVLSRVTLQEDPELFHLFAQQLAGSGWNPHARMVVVIIRYPAERGPSTEGMVPWFHDRGVGSHVPEVERMQIKGPEVLFQANHVLQKLKSREPVWSAHHERLNPPPPPPPRVWFSGIEDANAPSCEGPEEGQSVLSVIVEARTQVARGEFHKATGTYTWLWEHLDMGRPWLRPLRRTIVASEMADLARKREGTRGRFVAMRDEHVLRDAWADLPEQLDRFVMDEIVGELDQALMEYDYAINDPDEGSLIPYHQRRGLELIGTCTPLTDLSKITEAHRGRVASLPRATRQTIQKQATAEEWSHLIELRRQVLLLEVCRVHIAALRGNDSAEAARVAETLLPTDADGSVRLALASMAWAAGLADQRHIAWVHEAIALGADDAGLSRMLGGPDGNETIE